MIVFCRLGLSLWLVFAVLQATAASSSPPSPPPRWTVEDPIRANHGRSWRAAFDLETRGDEVIVEVAINLIPVDGVSRREAEGRREVWSSAIREVWSDRFDAVNGSGERFPIRIVVRFKSHEYHHRVRVRSSHALNDQLHWGLRASPFSVAHEFGHMIGAYDEYASGGTDPLQPVLEDEESIMVSRPAAGVARARHFERIRKALVEYWGEPTVEILPRSGDD